MTAKTRGLLCCVGCVLNIGFAFLCTNLVGLFCVPLASNLGVEYSSIALIWTSLSIGSICSRFFAGRLFDKVNPKIICAVSAVMYLFALPGMTLVKSPTAAIILFFFVGIINAFTGTLPFQLLGSKWIGVGRGTVIGLAPIFSAIFDMVFAPIGAAFATEYGFERTALAAGAILCLRHILVSLICISKEPAAYGEEPIDLKFLQNKKAKTQGAAVVYETKMPISHIAKLPVFWILMIMPALLAIAMQSFYSNRAGVYETMGLTLTQTAFMVGFYSISNCVLVWLFGFLCDKIGFRKTVLLYAAVGAILWFAWPVLKSTMFVGALVIAGFANVSQINNYFGPNVMIPLFGTNKSNTLISWSTMIAALGGAVAPIIVNRMSSYDTVFLMNAVIYVLVFALALVATSPRALDRIKEEDQSYTKGMNISTSE